MAFFSPNFVFQHIRSSGASCPHLFCGTTSTISTPRHNRHNTRSSSTPHINRPPSVTSRPQKNPSNATHIPYPFIMPGFPAAGHTVYVLKKKTRWCPKYNQKENEMNIQRSQAHRGDKRQSQSANKPATHRHLPCIYPPAQKGNDSFREKHLLRRQGTQTNKTAGATPNNTTPEPPQQH